MACHATSAPTHVRCGSRPSAWHGGLQWSTALTGVQWSAAQRYHALADGQPWEQGHPCWQTPLPPAQMPPCPGACIAVLAQELSGWQSWPASSADSHCCRPACLPALKRALFFAWLGQARPPVHAHASCCRSQDLRCARGGRRPRAAAYAEDRCARFSLYHPRPDAAEADDPQGHRPLSGEPGCNMSCPWSCWSPPVSVP